LSIKETYKFILLVVAIMIIVPVITNSLMFVGNFKVAGNEGIWIGYFGSYWGAIIGGVVSGAITLIGVRQTILYQIRKDRLERLPGMIVDSWKIHKRILYIYGLEGSLKERPDLNDIQIMQSFAHEHEEWMTDLAASIDPRMYNIINSFFTHIDDYYSYKSRGNLEEWFKRNYEFYKKSSDLVSLFETEYEKHRLV
jgi:hypothetical protein